MTTALIISNVLLWLVVVALAGLVFALVRQVGVLHGRLAPAGALAMNAALKVGDPVTPAQHPSLNGGHVDIAPARDDGRRQLLFFLAPDCPVCKTLLPAIRSIARDEADTLDVILASDGYEPAQKRFIAHEKLQAFPYILSEALGRRLGVAKLPYGVLIAPDGTVAAFGLVNTREHLESLLTADEMGVTSIQDYLTRQHEDADDDNNDQGASRGTV